MRILIISWYFPPLASVASERIWCFARYLSEAGHSVEVLTDSADDAYGRNAAGWGMLPGVNVHRISSPVQRAIERRLGFMRAPTGTAEITADEAQKPWLRRTLGAMNQFRIRRGLGYLGRMPDITHLWHLSAKRWLRTQPGWDVVISSYAPYSSLLLGRYAQRLGKCRLWVADFRDLWTQHHLFRGLFPFTLLERMMERHLVRHADLVTTVSDGLAQVLRRDHGHPHVGVVCNGYRPLSEIAAQPSPLPQTSHRILLHTGTLYPEQQDIAPLFAGLALLREQHPAAAQKLLLAFAGGNVNDLKPLIAEYGCQAQTVLLGLLPPDAARVAQHEAAALLYIGARPGAYSYSGVIPCKLFEYAASGSQVLALGAGDNGDMLFLRNAGVGHWVDNQPVAICQALKELAEGEIRELGPRNEAWIAQFSRHAQTEVMRQMITGALARQTAAPEST